MMLSNVGGEKTITEVNVKSYNHPHSHFLLIMQRKFNLNINLVHIDHFFYECEHKPMLVYYNCIAEFIDS